MTARWAQQTSALIELLCAAKVEFAVIGGVAAVLHGSARMTLDLDIVAPFSLDNLRRLLDALEPHDPRHVTRPDLSVLDEPLEHLQSFRMLLIDTKLGRRDRSRCADRGQTPRRSTQGHRSRLRARGVA